MSIPLTPPRAGATWSGMPRAGTCPVTLFAALWVGCAGSAVRSPTPAPAIHPGPASGVDPASPPASDESGTAARLEQFVRVRCATDGSDVFTTWRGHVWGYADEQAPRLLFEVVGMNVARCALTRAGWSLTSRELMLYLDPDTGAVLHRWKNPWTDQEVTVAHVANSPVQAVFADAPTAVEDGAAVTYVIDVPLYYPNPLASDPETRFYSPQPMYRAGEFFTLSAPASEVRDPERRAAATTTITWHRVGPWLPWMAMGEQRGMLVYSAAGRRVAGLDQLDPLLRAEIAERLPRYRSAPRCYLAAGNATSWKTFAADLDAYRRGDRLPRPAPDRVEPCADPAP